MKGQRMTAAAVSGALLGVMALTGPAEATIYDRFEESGTFVGPRELCGLELEHAVEFSSKGYIRQGKGKQAGAFFFHDNYSTVQTFTNPATDKFFTISHNGVFKEIKATPVGDDVFEFVDHDAGQPFVVRDMDGNVLLRDRGLVSVTYLFDTGGDDVPGGEFVELLDIRLAGPHPGFFLEPGDECPSILDLLT